MIAANGGCVGPRGVMDTVDFGVKRNQLSKKNQTMTPQTNPRRSERLHDKGAILFKHNNSSKKSPRGNHHHHHHHHHGHKSKRTHQPDDDDDWGITPTRREKTRAMTRSFENNETIPTISKSREATPSERLRNFKSKNSLTNHRPITPMRAYPIETGNSPGKYRLDQSKISNWREGQHRLDKREDKEKSEEHVMMDITSRQYNHSIPQMAHHQQRNGPELFQSERKKYISKPKQIGIHSNVKKEKKKQQAEKTGVVPILFEHSQREYDERDRRRREVIVNTVRSMEAMPASYGSGEASSITIDTGSSSYLELADWQRRLEENRGKERWDKNHYVASKKLDEALAPIQHHGKPPPQQQQQQQQQKDNTSMVETVTDWGVEAIVSDLSHSMSLDSMSAAPTKTAIPMLSATSATQRLQKALAEAKKQIYPTGSCENLPPEVLVTDLTGKYECGKSDPHTSVNGRNDRLIVKDTTNGDLQASRPFQKPSRRNVGTIPGETPKRSNTARTRSFERIPLPSEVPNFQRARSKSPDPLALLLGPPKRLSRSETCDRQRNHEVSHWESNVVPRRSSKKATTPTRETLFSSVSEGKHRNPGEVVSKSSLPFGRSRSATPTKDRRLQDTTPTTGSSQRRPVTPNRLWASRRRPTPGQMLANDDQDIDCAEEKLTTTKQHRESGDSRYSQEELYVRPRITIRREGLRDSSSSFSSFDRPLGGKSVKSSKQFDQRQNVLKNSCGGHGSATTQSTECENYYSTPLRGPHDPPSKRWFGRHREELQVQDKFEDTTFSLDSDSTRARNIAKRLSSILEGDDVQNHTGHSKEKAARSERMMKHMMTFDSLMKAIEDDERNSLGAEFAVVELGDEESAVQTHAILMNRDDVEDQLNARGTNRRRKR